MSMTLEQLATECQQILSSNSGPDGRGKVAGLIADLLKDDAFVTQHITDDGPERKILYEDPTLGFCILAHNYKGAKESAPHDHGPTWAIYGQARGETVMSDWTVLQPATAEKPGKVKLARTYPLKRGDAHVYNEGDVHSPRRDGPTKLIRVEGRNMDREKRFSFEKA